MNLSSQNMAEIDGRGEGEYGGLKGEKGRGGGNVQLWEGRGHGGREGEPGHEPIILLCVLCLARAFFKMH